MLLSLSPSMHPPINMTHRYSKGQLYSFYISTINKILFLLTPPSCPIKAMKVQSDCKKDYLIHNIQRTLALNSPLSVPPFHLQDQKSYRNKLERRLFYYSFTMVLRAMRCNSLWKFTSEKHMGLLTGINTSGLPLTTLDTSLHQQH